MGKITTISANTLFHFTSDINNLIGILTNNFYPRYSLENYSAFWPKNMEKKLSYSNVAIPMVSFCDIPLSNIRNHINVYGRYAIGLTKEWGERNNINPIMYALDDSIYAKVIKSSLNNIDKCVQKLNTHRDRLYLNNPKHKKDKKDKLIDTFIYELLRIDNGLLDIMSYTKNYSGKFNRNGKKNKKVCFYDEREWRYIPDPRLLFKQQLPNYIPKEIYLDVMKRKEANDKLERTECMLKFEPDDIRYIIVSKHDEILRMVDRIHEIKGSKYGPKGMKLLTTRIISMEQILQDF
ncbi:abortive infection system antitoxin AbiGi family protein [Candidatus Margulisiibacteriota bacterium]